VSSTTDLYQITVEILASRATDLHHRNSDIPRHWPTSRLAIEKYGIMKQMLGRMKYLDIIIKFQEEDAEVNTGESYKS
jgi:hypothetical protein